jgi:cellulose synthase/poly-beta-1,6-N-acetylglucosamine synthase-like glycosyltransferase
MSLWLAIVVVYGIALFGLSLYSLNHAALVAVFLRRRRQPAQDVGITSDPVVTIQLPLFNELYVAERVIRSACEVDYPRELLEIQVLDDSTDETLELTRRLVRDQQARGVPIVHLHRDNRKGFKSGALAYGFEHARGEFIAVFDADFVIPRDFLRRTIPHFADPQVGIVQTRWTYFNDGYSELTRATALALDGHFVVEQAARCWAGWFLNFNGTAGILRRQAIADAGGWQDDTITEDLDLSYRAQLVGWRAKYLPDVVCPSEIPADMHSLKAQQFRWTKGAQETARKVLPRLWRSDVAASVKWQGTMHLLSSLAYPLLIILTLLSPFVVFAAGARHLKIIWPISLYYLLAFSGTFLCYYTAARVLGGSWRQRIARFPLFLALSIGMSVHNARAALEGLLGKRSPFERTPKYRVTSYRVSRAAGRYRSRASWSVLGEFLLSACSFVALGLAIHLRQFGAIPFTLLFAMGYGMVGVYSLSHLRFASRRATDIEGAPSPHALAAPTAA